MVENDTFTYSIRKSVNVQAIAADHSLITQERTQKLDLLIHLISNLTQTLVICGPQGIGKTTLLRALQERKIESWSYCLIQGNANLSFETFQEQVNRVIRPEQRGKQVSDFSPYQGKNNKIVLLIDDAGTLVPGLITTIMQYSWTNPLLRVVFALTPDELHVKTRTDSVVEDCHFVEIPPLSEKQCGDFLQQLSAKPWARLSLNAINDTMIKNIYRQTHGIPGKIIAEIPGLAQAQKSINSIWILLAAVAGLIAVAFGIQWYSSTENNLTEAVPPVAVEQLVVPVKPSIQAPETVAPKQPVQASEQILDQYVTNGVSKLAKPQTTVVSEPKPDTTTNAVNPNPAISETASTKPAVEVEQKPVEQPAPASEESIQPPESVVAPEATETAITETDGDQWLNTQPPGHYTLQVMLLSKEQGIKDLQKKYPALAQDLRYIKTMIGGREKFLLFYGSFNDQASAGKAKQQLPREFSHSLVKKIGAFKK